MFSAAAQMLSLLTAPPRFSEPPEAKNPGPVSFEYELDSFAIRQSNGVEIFEISEMLLEVSEEDGSYSVGVIYVRSYLRRAERASVPTWSAIDEAEPFGKLIGAAVRTWADAKGAQARLYDRQQELVS